MIYTTTLKKVKELNIPKDKCLIIGEAPPWETDYQYASIFMPGYRLREDIKTKEISKEEFAARYLEELGYILNVYEQSEIEWLNHRFLVEQEGNNPNYYFRHLLGEAIEKKFKTKVEEATKENIINVYNK